MRAYQQGDLIETGTGSDAQFWIASAMSFQRDERGARRKTTSATGGWLPGTASTEAIWAILEPTTYSTVIRLL